MFFAFVGFDEVITLSEETENPTRTVPLALVLALGISTLLYVAVAVTAAWRLLYGMSSRGSLPSLLSVAHSRRRTPAAAILLSIMIAAGFVMFRDLKLVARVTDFAVYLVFLAVNATVVILRFKQPDLRRGFRIPGSIGPVPDTPALGCATVMTQLDLEAAGLGLLLLALGLLTAAVLNRIGAGGAA